MTEEKLADIETAVGSIVWEMNLRAYRPVILKGKYRDYETVAEEMSINCARILVWTHHGTPLKKKRPQKADITFGDHPCSLKYRIVVFESKSDIFWYASVRRSDRKPRHWRLRLRRKKFIKYKRRVRAFERACSSGVLLFTATDILAQAKYEYHNLDVGYIENGEEVYCFQSELALKKNDGKVKDITLFKLTHGEHEHVKARDFYHCIYNEVSTQPSDYLFLKPEHVAEAVRWNWWIRRAYWTTRNRAIWLVEILKSNKVLWIVISILFVLLDASFRYFRLDSMVVSALAWLGSWLS